MAWNETKATLTGRICTDVRVYNADDEERVFAVFSVATNERKFDKETNAWVRGRELFMKVKCFRRLAGSVAATFVKGDPVVVTGKLYTNKWEKDGQTRSELEMEASAMGPDLTFCKIVLLRDERSGMPIETVAA
ncbi:single-stranded DNA-binding protein [Kibdelosporangium philippinense]|uniref:Single-stranded DNA-binding protein n=1 Tax=Kibdelosporangium philippinense TaxID=211113 RepID=A0ABS8ZI89_9PSEU|nr:single-stranded DNA-binding protein [Kibdelosporangium philippinense]MCE7007521.1 single-stranded DNA-binding protein [Kibdelosporangium philippinense]